METYDIPGIALALVSKDSILFTGGLGMADKENRIIANAQTHFRIGSISKSFIALALLKLKGEGLLNLEDPVKKLAPEIAFDNPWEDTHPVLVMHLLEHTSGFDDMHFSEIYDHDYSNLSLKSSLIAYDNSRVVRWPAGTRYAYSNSGYALAGYLIEKISGRLFEDYIFEEILKPMGMQVSNFRNDGPSKNLLAKGYDQKGLKPLPYLPIRFGPAGSLQASAREMGHFLQFMLNRGMVNDSLLFTEGQIERMEYPQSTLASKHGLKLGYGLGNNLKFYKGIPCHGHDGGIHGFSASYRYFPESDVAYALLINRERFKEFEKIETFILNYLLSSPPKNPSIQTSPLPKDIKDWIGFYQFKSPRNKLFSFTEILISGVKVKLRQDKIYVKPFLSSPREIHHTGKLQFRERSKSAPTILFGMNDDTRFMQINGRYYEQSSGTKVTVLRGVMILSLLLMLSAFLFGLLSALQKLSGNMEVNLYLRVLPAIPFMSTLLALFAMNKLSYALSGTFNLYTCIIFLCSVLIPLGTIGGMYFQYVSRKEENNNLLNIFSWSLYTANACWSIYLGYFGLIGIRLWAY